MVKAKNKEGTQVAKQFKIKKEKVKVLKAIIETLAGVADETKIAVTPEELVVKAMDQSRICLLKLSIKKEHFDDYECLEPCEIGINLSDLDKILKRGSASDSVELSFKEEEQKIKLKMQREGSTKTRTFSLNVLDVDIEEIPMDNLLKIEYDAKWTMPLEILIEATKDAEIYSEVLNARVGALLATSIEVQGLVFTSAGQIGEMEYDITADDLIEPDIEGESIGTYSINFLKAIAKIAPVVQKLEMGMKTDHPLKMAFDLLEGGELIYFLAPRVEEQEFEEGDGDIESDDLRSAEKPSSEPEEKKKVSADPDEIEEEEEEEDSG